MKNTLKKAADSADNLFDTLTDNLSNRLMADGKVHIHPYNGMGNQERLFLRGRVLLDKEIPKSEDQDSYLKNLLNTWQHITSIEIDNTRVGAKIGGLTHVVKTDSEGFFEIEMDNPGLPEDVLWHDIELELLDRPDDRPETATGQIMIPPANAEYGVISDIDDTVLQSKATNYLAAATLMFFKNAKTRLPFEGVAELYQSLQKNGRNPICYVSSSPWNLYELLTDFFDYQDVPAGPLFLTDYGFSADQFIKPSHGDHKLEQIEHILNFYPNLQFILMGDSGQKDPEIYQKAVAHHAQQIKACVIRDVTNARRDQQVAQIAADVSATGTDMIFAADSVEMRNYFEKQGILS